MRKMPIRDRRLLAAIALCDVRTVERYLRGEMVRPSLRERIEAALPRVRADIEQAGAA